MQVLTHYFALYGYAALLPLALVEGPVVAVFAGMLAAQGLVDFAFIYGVMVACELVRDVGYYAAGRWLPNLLSFHDWRWTARLRERAATAAPQVRASAGKMLLVGKLTHFAGFATLLAAGAVRMPLFRYLLYNLIGTLPKSLLLMVVGYSFARVYLSLEGDSRIIGVTGFALAAGVLFLMARRMLSAGDSRGT